MTAIEAVLGTVSLFATGITVYVGLKFDPLKELVGQERADRTVALNDQAEIYEKRIDAIHSDKKDLERRMNEIEKNALSRPELERVEARMIAAVDRLGDKMGQAIKEIGARLDHALERVAQVEAKRD